MTVTQSSPPQSVVTETQPPATQATTQVTNSPLSNPAAARRPISAPVIYVHYTTTSGGYQNESSKKMETNAKRSPDEIPKEIISTNSVL